jgi:hypothetical protein
VYITDEWNPDVRLIDYAHALLWLLYQPNLGSRLNGAVPSDESEYAELVHKSLQGKTVAGVAFPPMIPAEPEPVEEYPQQSVAQLVAMFNAPHPPPPPPLGFRMRIPTTTTAAATVPVTRPITVAPVVVIDTTAPAAPAPPTAEQLRAQAPRQAADTREADTREADAEAEAEEEEEVVPEPRAGRQVRALRRSSERVAELSRTAAASPRRQRHAGPNQEKQSRNQPSSTKPQQRRRGNNNSRSSTKKTQTKRRASANA